MQLEKFIENILARFQLIPNNDARAKVGTGTLISILVFFFSRSGAMNDHWTAAEPLCKKL